MNLSGVNPTAPCRVSVRNGKKYRRTKMDKPNKDLESIKIEISCITGAIEDLADALTESVEKLCSNIAEISVSIDNK